MNQNLRFYALIAAVLVVVGGLFYFIRGNDKGDTKDSAPVASKAETPATRDAAEAPTVTSTRRESRLTATASRPSAPREMTTSKKIGNYAISGQVVLQEDESPVEGAEVSIYWTDKDAAIQTYDDDNVWRARTNVKGFYRVDKLPPSQYIVIATKDDLAGVSGTAINAREPEDNIVNLSLRASGVISGNVINEQREPIPGALIALGQGKRGQRDIYGGNTQTKSAPDGSFTLNFVDDGTWTINAKAEGYAVAEVNDVALNSENVEIVMKKGASLSGSVVSVDTTKPVPNVSLILSLAGGRYNRLGTQKVSTDADGKFVFPDLADGAYGLALDKQPYVISGQVPPITIEGAKSIENIQLNVVMGGSISGRATDAETGAPIVGMQFSARGGSGGMIRAETDEDGVFKLEGLQAGQYTVRRMWMAGYRHGEDREDKSATVGLGEEVTGIDFAVPPGLTMRGRVVDKTGEPIPMVNVTSADATNNEGETMVTDEKGRWVHRGFSPGTVVTITASKAGYSAPPMENVTIPDHELTDIEIVMDAGASIAGVVVDKEGNPLDDVYVTAVASNPASPDQRQQTAWSRDGGKFKVQGLSEGAYKLQARPPRSWGQPTPTGNDVQVAKGENVTGVKVVVDFDSGSKIAGRVVDSAGKPIKGANVNAYMPTGGGGGNDESDDDGKYEIVGLQPGAHWVNVYHNNYTQFRQEQVEAPNPNFNITLRGKATIKGRVLEARSGQPVRTFSIMTMSGQVDRVDPGNYWGNSGQTFVSDQGEFEIRADDGGATLYVQAQGYAPATHKIPDAKEGQTKSGVDIRLDSGGAIEGTVITKTGERVAGARIYTGRAPMGDWERRERPSAATTDANGAFRIDSLPAQEVRLYALHESYASATATATPSAGGAPASVQIVLGSGGTVKGVVRVDGKPASGYGVSIWAQDGGHQNNVNVGSNGEYSFTGLPEGSVSLTVYSNRGGTNRNVSKQAEIVADQTTTVDFDMVSGNAVLEGSVTRAGQAVSGAWVNVNIRTEGDTNEASGVQSGANGSFRFEGLPPGMANVMIHENVGGPSGQRTRSFRVELVNDETTRLDADLDSGARVNGKVTGAPQGWMTSVMLVTGAVEIPADANLQEMYQGLTDRMAGGAQAQADGSFTIEGAQPGEYTAIVVAFDPQSGGQTFKHATASVSVPESGEASVNVTLP
ncbi:MAG: carboxypeptidase regulatory-like domain-containing protein [Candidatus Hydrogenedentes bacterium]|nr:carboxypeptidase regulatory-like domain-containing protein [Candidatus Hydrogenedentota bacterium]